MRALPKEERAQRGLQLVRPVEAVIETCVYDRIPPGDYAAFSRAATIDFDEDFERWVCAVWWNIFPNASSSEVIARVPWWLNLGKGKKPYAGRRSYFRQAWLGAQGNGPLPKANRPSAHIFARRNAMVRVRDTKKGRMPRDPFDPYSVVEKVLEWQTGGGPSIQPSNHPTFPRDKGM